MEKQENLHKELDLIQGVVTRMANNSFLVKGWAMTLMSALIAFGKDTVLSNPNGAYYLIMMLAVLIPFWWLDAFYLRQEQIFRKVYKRAVADPEAVNHVRYDLDPKKEADKIQGTWALMTTEFLRWFYIPFIILIAIGILLKLTGIFGAVIEKG